MWATKILSRFLGRRQQGPSQTEIATVNENTRRAQNKIDQLSSIVGNRLLSPQDPINAMAELVEVVKSSAGSMVHGRKLEFNERGYSWIPIFTAALLKDPEIQIRILAAEALGYLGGLGHAEVLPALKKALETEDVPKVHNMISSAKTLSIFQKSLK